MILLLLWLGIKLSMPPLYFIILLAALLWKLIYGIFLIALVSANRRDGDED